MTTEAPASTESTSWARLCALLDPDPEVAHEVTAALAAGAPPWAALIDALDDAGALACLDRADTGDLLVDALGALPRVARARLADTGRPPAPDLRAVVDLDDLDEAIAAARGAIAAVGLDLVALDEGDGDDECLPSWRCAARTRQRWPR
ncbi:DUF6630 family protein [Litorihabitans aurantiacus]|uniref:DUF6630 domain-containing protein n=1 Tax=Litorihabitans aurantiacus TaxID=1930061 RepID=A0AA37XJ76_9MICO|nr:hypothetical protein [Litorihabitans aurantiacus]GMA33380.1 hypothetical protein GCM10025875_33720 [Litorihabitans aurantiacus]